MRKKEFERIDHEIPPFVQEDSFVLILGTMPSPKSRASGFYYGHPQNRFWKILAWLFETDVPVSIDEKKIFLKAAHIALWDVLASCEIIGASDESIRDAVPNDIHELLEKNPQIRTIFTNGAKAGFYYQRVTAPLTHREAIALPSTSPANCRFSFEEMLSHYQLVRDVVLKFE